MSNAMKWQDLVVWNEGQEWGPLGKMVEKEPESILRYAVIEDGQITEWQYYCIAAPGEEYDADTPRGEVDWSGFAAAVEAARGAVAA